MVVGLSNFREGSVGLAILELGDAQQLALALTVFLASTVAIEVTFAPSSSCGAGVWTGWPGTRNDEIQMMN